jgi:2-oxoglutarate ferredoxin oxidoreductase subunit delta
MSRPVDINEAWCKGCVICVDICPTHVIEMQRGKAVAVRQEECIGCLQCEYHCPDMAIAIHKEFVVRKKAAAASRES